VVFSISEDIPSRSGLPRPGIIGFWQTWVGVEDIARTLFAFALSSVGAFFTIKVIDWIRYEVGPQKRANDVSNALQDMRERKHTDVPLRFLQTYGLDTRLPERAMRQS
jgi:hypothetical protein